MPDKITLEEYRKRTPYPVGPLPLTKEELHRRTTPRVPQPNLRGGRLVTLKREVKDALRLQYVATTCEERIRAAEAVKAAKRALNSHKSAQKKKAKNDTAIVIIKVEKQ